MHVDFTDSLEAVIKTNSEITVSIIESIYVFYIYPTVKTSISKHLTTIICPELYCEVYGAFSQLSQEMWIISSLKKKC